MSELLAVLTGHLLLVICFEHTLYIFCSFYDLLKSCTETNKTGLKLKRIPPSGTKFF